MDEIFLLRLLRDNRAVTSFRPVEVNIIDPIAVRDEASWVPPTIGVPRGEPGALTKHKHGTGKPSWRDLDGFPVHLAVHIPAKIVHFKVGVPAQEDPTLIGDRRKLAHLHRSGIGGFERHRTERPLYIAAE